MTTAHVPEQTFAIIPLACIRESITNPRKSFDPVALEELAGTIRDHGVTTPILVRPIGAVEGGVVGEVEIVYGARRFRASKLAGKETIPAMVQVLTDEQVRSLQIIENLQREDVNPMEEAEGYKSMMDDFGYTTDKLAAAVKRSKAYIYGRLKLCTLPTDIRAIVIEGKLPASTAELIARMPSVLQARATEEIVHNHGDDEPMSYRVAAEYIRNRYMLDLAKASFPIADAKLIPKAGSCEKCPKRTGNSPDLFHDVKSADVCTDPDCFSAKRKAYDEKTITVAKKKGIPVYEDEIGEEKFTSGDYATLDDSLHYFERITPGVDEFQDIGEALPERHKPEPIAYALIDGKPEPLFDMTAMQLALEKAGLCETVEAHAERIKEEQVAQPKQSKKSSIDPQAEEQKFKGKQAELHQNFRTEIYNALRNQIDFSNADHLRKVVSNLLDECGNDYGVMTSLRKYRSLEDSAELDSFIENADIPALNLIILDLVTLPNLSVSTWDIDKKGNPTDSSTDKLLPLAMAAEVDVEEIRARIFPAPKPKEKKEKKAKQATVQPDENPQPDTENTESDGAPAAEGADDDSSTASRILRPELAWPFPNGARPEPRRKAKAKGETA